MEFKRTYLENLVNKKANKDNSICLNAYALGIKDSKAPEMLEMLKKCLCVFENYEIKNNYSETLQEIKFLIKKSTQL